MNVPRGYRIRLEEPGSLGDFVSSLRSASLRVFARRYGVALADEVARRIDLSRAGVDVREADASPLRESVEQMRSVFAGGGRAAAGLGLDLRLRFHLVGAEALVRVEDGHADFLAEVEGLPGVLDASFPANGPPEGLPAAEWEERRGLWEAALSGPPLASGLGFRLVEGGLPSLRYAALRRHFPQHDVRCRRTARALLFLRRTGEQVPRDAAQARDFRRYLDTAKGQAALDQEVRHLARVLPNPVDQASVLRYGQVPEPRTAPVAEPAPPPCQPSPIDHADVIESGDGRIFVAVMDAGLATDERIHIQVVERHVAFVQNGIHFGGIPDVPHKAVDLLRESREAIVVELSRVPGRREIKARHVALVRDDGRPDVYTAAMANFRNAAERNRRVQSAQWME